MKKTIVLGCLLTVLSGTTTFASDSITCNLSTEGLSSTISVYQATGKKFKMNLKIQNGSEQLNYTTGPVNYDPGSAHTWSEDEFRNLKYYLSNSLDGLTSSDLSRVEIFGAEITSHDYYNKTPISLFRIYGKNGNMIRMVGMLLANPMVCL